MPKKRDSIEPIIAGLRDVEITLGQGSTVAASSNNACSLPEFTCFLMQ